MTFWNRFRSWVHAILQRSRMEREMDAELHFHLDAYTEDLVRTGVSREEAMRQARLEFGGIEQSKEQCRDARGVNFLYSLQQDLRLALRMLRKSPGFTAVAVITLALGIGANTAIFSVVDAILLRPLPYPQSTQLVHLWETAPSRGSFRNVVNAINFLDWQDHSKSFQSMAAITGLPTNLSAQGQPIVVPGLQVSPEFFSVLKVLPFLGRTFTADDGIAGHDQVVILSYELWQRQFGGDAAVIGEKLDVNGRPSTVIGVMPRGFSFPNTKAEVWTPLPLARTEEWKDGRYLTVIARLKPGVTLQQASQDMLSVGNITAQARPDTNKGWSAEVIPMLEDTTHDVQRPLWVLLASVVFLLLIACSNVANLLLMRGSGRLREMAVRSALGAARLRLIQQLLVESLLLSLAGMAAGLLLAQLGLHTLLALIPQNASLPRSEPITIDGRVLLFTFLAAVFTSIVFGLVPALHLFRVDLQSALKQGSLRGGVGGHQTLRRSFVVAEVTLALLLSVGAGLMLRSFSRLVAVDPGFHPEHLLTMHIFASPARYSDDLKRSVYFDRILTEIRNSPGVRTAGSTHFLPLTESTSGSCFALGGGPPPAPSESPSAQFLIISSGYLPAMGIPLLTGRDFEQRDAFDAPPVAIVNSAFVKSFLPRQDAVGKQLRVCWTTTKPVEIVGVAADARQADLQQAPQPTIFLSNSQSPMFFATFVLRAEGDPRQIARSAEDAIHRVDPDQAVSDVQTMDKILSDSISSPRFEAILLSVFASLAIVLAIIGIYGVVSYSVSQRTNEIGIRIAMGAHSRDIARLVLREALLLAAIALFLGFGASLVLSRLLQSLLFEVTPTDPVTLASAASVILAVSALAALLPARRAMSVDPMVALRYE
jgi:putative ABC transport system permease protein